MVYQALDSVGIVCSCVVQAKHLFVKDWHSPSVLQTQEQTQFQHSICHVIEM